MPSLIVAGHSHIHAFAPPPEALDAPVAVDADDARVLHGPAERDADYWRAFVAESPEVPHAIVWRGDQHLRALLTEPSPPVDFVLSVAPDLPLDPRASYLAEAQLRALFAPSFAGLAEAIAAARTAGAAVLVAGTPPPIGEAEAVIARLPADPGFAPLVQERADGRAKPVVLSSLYLLQKVWSLLQVMLAEAAGAGGATFVPVPDRTRTREGFLAPAHWTEDPVHANATFARELAADLRAALAGVRP